MATNLSTYLTQVQRLLHDANNVIWSPAELTDYINSARDQTCRDTECLRILQTGFFQQQTETFQFGALSGLSIVSGGGNYTLPPIPVITGGGFTSPPFATTSIANGVVVGTTIVNGGSGFNGSPIAISVNNAPGDTTGSGCALGAGAILASTLNVLNVTIIYGNTRYVLGWMPFSQFTAFMRPWTQWFQRPMQWSDYAGAQSFYIGPSPDQVYPFEIDSVVTPNALVDSTTVEQINFAHQSPVKYYAAFLAKMRQQAYGEADYYKDRYVKDCQLVANQLFTRRIPEPYGSLRSW